MQPQKIPPLISKLLGLGHKFCIREKLPKNHLNKTFERFTKSMRLKHWLHINNMENNGNYIPKIYVKTNWNPPPADQETEDALTNFKLRILELDKFQERKHYSNLNPFQNNLMKKLKENEEIVIGMSDKNLGPIITERDTYIKKAFTDHLSDEITYEHLSQQQAYNSINSYKEKLEDILSKHKKELSHAEKLYFARSLHKQHRTPQMYLNPKVHKTTINGAWKTRPVVSCCGSYIEIYSKWLDYHLQKLIKTIPSYLRDSFTLIEYLRLLPTLPENAKLTRKQN